MNGFALILNLVLAAGMYIDGGDRPYERNEGQDAEITVQSTQLDEDNSGTSEAMAQTITATANSPYPTRGVEELKNALSEHKQAASEDGQQNEAVRVIRLQVLSAANETLLRLNESENQRLALENQIKTLRESEYEWRRQLNSVLDPESPTISDHTTAKSLMRELEARRERLEHKKQELLNLEAKIRFHSERVRQIPMDRAQVNEKLKIIQEEIGRRAVSDDAENQLSLIGLELRRHAAEAELRKLDQEEKRQEWGIRIEPMQRDLAAREVQRLQQEITRWEVAAKMLRQEEVSAEQRLARDAANTAPIKLKQWAERNAELVIERERLADDLQELRVEQRSVETQIESILGRRKEIEKRIEAAGLTTANGMLLVDLRRNLGTTGECHLRIRQLQESLRMVNLKKFNLAEERGVLADPVGVANQLATSNDHPLHEQALRFVQTKRDYLDQLLDDYHSYIRTTSEVCEARKKLIDVMISTWAYIDKTALWMRSAEQLQLSHFSQAKYGLDEFLSADQWSQMVHASQWRMMNGLYESTVAAALLLVLIGIYWRTQRLSLINDESGESYV